MLWHFALLTCFVVQYFWDLQRICFLLLKTFVEIFELDIKESKELEIEVCDKIKEVTKRRI